MNRLLLSVSTACLVLATTATPALAGNRVTVVQNGSTLIVQTIQDKGSNGLINIDQVGIRNTVRLDQNDVDGGLDRGAGAATAAFITQAGHDNTINTFTTVTTPLLGQRETAYGQGNITVQISQDGDHNAANFDQSGDYQHIIFYQQGHGNETDMAQADSGNNLDATQSGENNAARLKQPGTNGTMKLDQGGSNNQLASVQFGNSDFADLHQSGTGNYAAVNQYSDNDEALLNQHGTNGFVVVQQTTANAMANLSQVGTGNSITSVQ